MPKQNPGLYYLIYLKSTLLVFRRPCNFILDRVIYWVVPTGLILGPWKCGKLGKLNGRDGHVDMICQRVILFFYSLLAPLCYLYLFLNRHIIYTIFVIYLFFFITAKLVLYYMTLNTLTYKWIIIIDNHQRWNY